MDESKYKKYRPVKFLGQNFLVDENIAKKIVKNIEITPDDLIIEIGPGYGALTKYILNETGKYIGIELDEKFIKSLKGKFPDINLINRDFLKLNIAEDISKFNISCRNIKIAGNIPYNITSQILFKLFDNKHLLHSAVIMSQKEVAQRLTAPPNTKEYGILAVQTQINSKVKLLFNLPPSVFFPKPKVDSTVFKLTFQPVSFIPEMPLFTEILRTAFNQRRKTLKNSLSSFFEKYSINTSTIDFDFSLRPEQLSPQDFIDLHRIIYLRLNKPPDTIV
jgi:16S rRNA (adenine1518-N6/adenine1519-N6)-dimethyltransferase